LKNLVLVGGGHSHAIALHFLATHPLSDVCLTLISDVLNAPYSGMLPGHIGGFYAFEEAHINLKTLAGHAKAHLILDRAVGLDLAQNLVLCDRSAPISFDWLSIDTGSTPAQQDIPGVAEYTIPAKPVPQFLEGWNQFLQNLDSFEPSSMAEISIGIVGGGAGGVELALNMQARLQTFPIKIHLFHRREHLLEGSSVAVGRRFEQLLGARGICLHLGEQVSAVKPAQDSQNVVVCQSGLRVQCDRIFWLTHAAAPLWPQAAGLATDERGFILVNDRLQSVSHPYVFATGDIASMVHHPRPKAGVFAVRQGKPLVKNLRRVIVGQPLQSFYPQKRYLALVGTGDHLAIGLWGSLCFGPSQVLWLLKDWIDRRFMAQFKRASRQ
jgi:pyridine nucleotide-disulfide oxidoreductase family protein